MKKEDKQEKNKELEEEKELNELNKKIFSKSESGQNKRKSKKIWIHYQH